MSWARVFELWRELTGEDLLKEKADEEGEQ